MMLDVRKISLTLSVLVGMIAQGCGNDSITVPVRDLASSPPADAAMIEQDLSEPITYDFAKGPDLSKPLDFAGDFAGAKLGCHGLVGCYSNCEATSTTQAEYDTCSAACEMNAKSGAVVKYLSALSCGQQWCLNMGSSDPNAPSYKCKLGANQTSLVNLDGTVISASDPGTGQKACGACLNDALAYLLGGACTTSSSPDCDPAACQSIIGACLSDPP